MPIVPSPGDRVRSSLHRYTLLKLLNKGACANAFSATDARGEKWYYINGDTGYRLRDWLPDDAEAHYLSREAAEQRDIDTRRACGFYD